MKTRCLTYIAVGMGFLSIGILASDAARAENATPEINWILNCQGCHRADASGVPGEVPSMKGEVAKFLLVEGGRDYLIRVPGVAFAALKDDEIAALVNWMLEVYDPDHLPEDFAPYTAEEVRRLRRIPLVNDAAEMRARLMHELE
ncbi:c-type cytochrome [Luteithermobacter gelatinilyticus]|uniref:c-type cytochrome n=1 Tax=Luteithermobacter gelatinilyticus TaxID=2582913 RepID=UPI0011061F82|nr:cytochrome c [Luteithermobacter gelatinilyticus]